MTVKPWIDTYTPRRWAVYEFPTHSPELAALRKCLGKTKAFHRMLAESKRAEDAWGRGELPEGKIFADLEQLLSLDWDKYYGCSTYELTAPWRDHPAGVRVMLTYKGLDSEYYTVCVEEG